MGLLVRWCSRAGSLRSSRPQHHVEPLLRSLFSKSILRPANIGGHSPYCVASSRAALHSETILRPANFESRQTMAELVKHMCANRMEKIFKSCALSEAASSAVKQSQLPPRRMLDSFDIALIPLGSDLQLRDRYRSMHNKIRIGRLLEDLDIFAVHIGLKHARPAKKEGVQRPFFLVTALVDRIKLKGAISPTSHLRFAGHVTWVGTSSIETTINVEQLNSESQHWNLVIVARFVLVARDPSNSISVSVNPLALETEEEKALFLKGKENQIRRSGMSQDSLMRQHPTSEESKIIHQFFLKSLDLKTMSFKRRELPSNAIWMRKARLKSLTNCTLDHRNTFNKIFGGFIMRKAYELGFSNTMIYGREWPTCISMDDIWFRQPVEIGAMLLFSSQVCYMQDHRVQTRVAAEVLDPLTGDYNLTNVFQYTFQLSTSNHLPELIPRTYQEAMMYLSGRRYFFKN